MDLNKVQLIGRVAVAATVRTTPLGVEVAHLSIATNARWKDAAGAVQSKATFHNIILWKGLVKVSNYMKVGDKVYIEGRINVRTWLDQKTNIKRAVSEIVAENVILLSNKKEETTEQVVETADEPIEYDLPETDNQ